MGVKPNNRFIERGENEGNDERKIWHSSSDKLDCLLQKKRTWFNNRGQRDARSRHAEVVGKCGR